MELFHILTKPFRKPSPMVLAQQELEEARRQLLRAQTSLDYTKRIVDYHSDRVRRLTNYVKTSAQEVSDV